MPTLSSRLRALALFATTSLCVWLTAAPTITQQPGVVTAVGGTSASLTVAATGAGGLTYQWRRIGVPITGVDGPTFTLANFGPGDAGAYDVVVSDGPSSSTVSQSGWLLYRSAPGLLWGAGDSPALGIGATGRRDTPKVIADGVAQVVAGFNQSFFLKTDGTLWAAGENSFGVLGDGTTVPRNLPVPIATEVANVAAGFGHTLLLKRDGSLWAVGSNSSGQLGNNSTTDSLTPVPVATGVVQIAAGYMHSAFLKEDGSLWVFGSGDGGCLGNGSSDARLTPQYVTGGVKLVSAGAYSTVFVRTDGSLWGMGEWAYNTPTPIDTGVVSVASGNWRLFYVKTDGSLWYRTGVKSYGTSVQVDSGVAAVALSGWGAAGCYLKTDNTMWAYGADGSFVTPGGPGTLVATGVARIDSGSDHFLFLKPDGTLWSFGSYSNGQLGDGLSAIQSAPTVLADQVVAAAAGDGSSFTLKADGTLWGSGLNSSGQLGDGTAVFRSTPVLSASGVAAVAAGGGHSLHIDTAGVLWAMGGNGCGQLGDGTTASHSLRVRVTEGVVACAAGFEHSLYLKNDGTLWAMGGNSFGQLGDGTTTDRSTPVPVASGVVALAAGRYHSLFLKADGTLWAMGYNSYGQLGNGTGSSSSTPVPVASGVAGIAAGQGHSLFVKTDRTLWAVGDNSYGQLGDGTTNTSYTPVSVASDVAALAAGSGYSLFRKTDGTLWAMGYNVNGQLGDGTTTNRLKPVPVAAGVTSIAAGGSASLFIQQAGFGTAPAITTQPQAIFVGSGLNASLSVVATGSSPVGYQWYKDGVAIAGARSPQLDIVYATAADAGEYIVAVANAAGSIVSSPATLTLAPPPVITGEPVDVVVAPGGTATFAVAATGNGTLRYQWYKDGGAIAGQTGATLSLANAQRGDVGYYRVVVTDDFSSTISADAALNLTTFPIAAAAINQLGLGAAFDGTNFLVAIQGDASNATATTAQLVAPDGSLVGSRISVGRDGGEAGVGMGGVKAAFDGTNYLLVWADNAVAGTTRLYGVLVSKAGALVGSPFAFPLAAGASVYQRPLGIAYDGSRYLVVFSDGTDKPWKLCGRFVTPAGVVGSEMVFATNTVDSFQSVASNGNGFLVAWPARLGDSQYGVQARFVSGAGVLSAVVVIDADPSPSYNPLGVAGNGTDFLVAWNHDTGPGYPASTAWELRSRVVRADGSLPAAPLQLCSAATNPMLPIVAYDGGSYLVAWTQFTLGGTYPNVTSTPEDLSRAGGMDLAGRYLADDGSPLGAAFNLVVGSGNQGLAPLAAGNSACLVAYNELGADSGAGGANSVRGFILGRGVVPVVTAQPATQTVNAGATATFTVTTTGSGLTYQWQKDGVAIPGARAATLTLSNVQPVDFGSYAVVVTNAIGSVTSDPVLLGIAGVAGSRYRILDYFYPLAVGNEWLYSRSESDPARSNTRTRIADLDRAITSYSGGAAATPQTFHAVAIFNEYGQAGAGGFVPNEPWTDYFAANSSAFGFYGDDEAGPLAMRLDGSLWTPPTMAVGESSVTISDSYQNGVWSGPFAVAFRLLGIETVTTAAGTFNGCAHIRYSMAGAGPDELNDQWWAPGVGTVRSLRRKAGWTDTTEELLLSSTVAQPVLPAITTQPADATIDSGATASLAVAANGTAPLSYQWYRGDSGNTASPIVGATTASLTTPALTAWARYWVRVSNRSAFVDSRTVLVEVTGGTMKLGDWTAQPGTPVNQRGALDTPAGDGVTNLMKFALGVPPMASATAHLPTPTTYTEAGQPLAIALVFTKNPGAQAVDYRLLVSADMVTWIWVKSVVEVLGTNPDGTQLVRMREAAPPAAARRFAQLKVALVP